MKKFINLTILSALILCSMAAMPVDKAKKPFTLVGLYVANGSNYPGSISVSGASYLSDGFLSSTVTHVGDINTGDYYNITVYCNQPGTWIYSFPGASSQTTSVGHVTFTNVTITGSVTAMIIHG